MKEKCDGCKRAKGSDTIYTCSCNVETMAKDKNKSIEELQELFDKYPKINSHLEWDIKKLFEYATQQAEQSEVLTDRDSKIFFDAITKAEQRKVSDDNKCKKVLQKLLNKGSFFISAIELDMDVDGEEIKREIQTALTTQTPTKGEDDDYDDNADYSAYGGCEGLGV
jgi:hypothetical protein